MFKRIFGSKLTVLFLSMALIGFLIGYDYALLTTEQNENESIMNSSNDTYKIEVNQNEYTISESEETENTLIEEVEESENIEEAERLEDIDETGGINESEEDGSVEIEEVPNLETEEGLSEENE